LDITRTFPFLFWNIFWYFATIGSTHDRKFPYDFLFTNESTAVHYIIQQLPHKPWKLDNIQERETNKSNEDREKLELQEILIGTNNTKTSLAQLVQVNIKKAMFEFLRRRRATRDKYFKNTKLIFKPESIGIGFNGSRVSVVYPSSQAHLLGVASGWTILSLNGEPQPDETNAIQQAINTSVGKKEKIEMVFSVPNGECIDKDVTSQYNADQERIFFEGSMYCQLAELYEVKLSKRENRLKAIARFGCEYQAIYNILSNAATSAIPEESETELLPIASLAKRSSFKMLRQPKDMDEVMTLSKYLNENDKCPSRLHRSQINRILKSTHYYERKK